MTSSSSFGFSLGGRRLAHAGTAEAVLPASRCGQLANFLPLHLHDRGNDKLRNTFTTRHDQRPRVVVHDDGAYFSTEISIDGTDAVQHGYSSLEGQSRAGTNLCLEARRQGDLDAARDQLPLTGFNYDWLVFRNCR